MAGSSAGPCPADVLDVALERLVQCLTPTPHAWSRRQSLVFDHIQRLEQYWRANHNIRIQPFGSSLSGLCLADSDIDLGLFGSMHHVELESITPQQAKKLLYSVLNGIHRAQLADGKVQCVMGARVPVLKYKCALSGLDCDISIQGSGALVKANFMRLINQHCRTLSPLYRLVKLWASAHDVNDASRSTFNSTSLLYLTVLFLQTRDLVPPLQELVDPELLNDPARRLLCPPNKWLWDRSEHLQRLLDAAQGRISAWLQVQRQKAGPNWECVSIGTLLQGFFAFYASLFTDWVVGKHREVYADLWTGSLSSQHAQEEQLGKDYLFNLQDPFDPADCPARAIGTLSKTNNGVGILITYLVSCSHIVLQRYADPGSTGHSTLSGTASSSVGSLGTTDGLSSTSSLQDRLCQCLAWLFGPQAVLHLAQHDAAAAAGVASSKPWRHWAACPFDGQLAEKIQARIQQQRQQQQQSNAHGRSGRGRAETPAVQFRWLVSHLRAAVEPEAGPCVLCLEHLQLLNKRIEAGALHGALGAALAATAAGRRAAQHVNRQQLEDARYQWQQRRLPGPPLPQPDEHIFLLFKQLQMVLGSQRWQPKGTSGKKRKPVENSKAVKDAARHAVTQVALRMLELGASPSARKHHADPLKADAEDPAVDTFGEAPVAGAAAVAEEEGEEADGIGGFGLAAVLEQHGFMPLLQRWDFVDSNDTIWPKLLPLPEHLKPKRGGGAGLAAAEAVVSSSGGMVGAATDLAAAAMHAAADLVHLPSAHVDATADHDGSQPHHQQQQQRGTGVFVSSRQFLNKVLQEQQQGQQHKHSHHTHQQQRQDEHLQHKQDEGMDLQFDMELHTLNTSEGGVTSSSVALTGLTDSMQHLTVGIGITSHTAGAGSNSGHLQGGAQHGTAQQRSRQQRGKLRAVRHQAELIGSPGYGSAGSGGSSGFAAMSSPPAAVQEGGSQGFMSPLGGKAPGRASKGQQKPQHQLQQQQGSGQSTGNSGGRSKIAPVRQSPKLQARRRRYGCSPDAAVASVPIDFEPVGVQGLSMHGDGLAESYCRQLQEKLSSPSSTQQPQPVRTHKTQQQQQQQQQEVRHPAAILLSSATSGLVTAGASGSQGMGGICPPAAAGSYGSASSSSHGVTSPLSNKPQLRLQQASYKVKQLQQRISKTEAQVAVRQAEVAQYKKQLQDSLGANGKEYLLAPGDRAAIHVAGCAVQLMEVKNKLNSSEKALQMQQANLERALQKLPDLQRDLEAAQAAAAAQQAFAP